MNQRTEHPECDGSSVSPSLNVLSYTGTCTTPSSHHLRIKGRWVCISALKTKAHQPQAERRNYPKDACTVSVLPRALSSFFPMLCRFRFSTLDATSPSPYPASPSSWSELVTSRLFSLSYHVIQLFHFWQYIQFSSVQSLSRVRLFATP